MKELKRTIRLVARNLGTHHITGPEGTSRSSILTPGSPSSSWDGQRSLGPGEG